MGLLPDLEALYKDVHSHPELSMQETRTAVGRERLRAAGYDVTTGVGKTGVVGLLRTGDGPAVMLRADMDALPSRKRLGSPYASKVERKTARVKRSLSAYVRPRHARDLARRCHHAVGASPRQRGAGR